MSKPQYMPAPWVVGTSTERGAAPGYVHVLSYGENGPYSTVAVASYEADASLIAAAPELLAACEAAQRALLNYAPANTEAGSEPYRVDEMLTEAIRKAKGGAA